MSFLNRSFSLKEKILLLILAIVLVILFYYYAVDRPVRKTISESNAEADAIQTQLDAANIKLQNLIAMEKELDQAKEKDSMMPSYNGIKKETALLNDIMKSAEDYTLTFSDVTRNGDQIRREFSLQFTVTDYDVAVRMLKQISDSKYRCRISEVSCMSLNTEISTEGYYVNGKYVSVVKDGTEKRNNINYGSVQVNCTATFYETMFGGKEDSGLPKEEDVSDVAADE